MTDKVGRISVIDFRSSALAAASKKERKSETLNLLVRTVFFASSIGVRPGRNLGGI